VSGTKKACTEKSDTEKVWFLMLRVKGQSSSILPEVGHILPAADLWRGCQADLSKKQGSCDTELCQGPEGGVHFKMEVTSILMAAVSHWTMWGTTATFVFYGRNVIRNDVDRRVTWFVMSTASYWMKGQTIATDSDCGMMVVVERRVTLFLMAGVSCWA